MDSHGIWKWRYWDKTVTLLPHPHLLHSDNHWCGFPAKENKMHKYSLKKSWPDIPILLILVIEKIHTHSRRNNPQHKVKLFFFPVNQTSYYLSIKRKGYIWYIVHQKGVSFCGFSLPSWTLSPCRKRGLLWKERICSSGANSFFS